VLNLDAPAVHDSACYVETSQPYALLDSAATARVVNAPTDVGAWTMMSINGPDIWVEYGLGEDRLRVNAYCPGSASHFWIDSAPAAGRTRLRIRHGQGTLFFDAANDGDDIWGTVDTTTCAVPAAGVTIGLQLTFWLPTAASDTRYHATLDDYNLGP
jgi:hypothetical protein